MDAGLALVTSLYTRMPRHLTCMVLSQALANKSPSGQLHQIDGVVLTKFDTIDTKVTPVPRAIPVPHEGQHASAACYTACWNHIPPRDVSSASEAACLPVAGGW